MLPKGIKYTASEACAINIAAATSSDGMPLPSTATSVTTPTAESSMSSTTQNPASSLQCTRPPSASASAPSPRPTAGLVHNVCDSCSLAQRDNSTFVSDCNIGKLHGDLNEYVVNRNGIPKAVSQSVIFRMSLFSRGLLTRASGNYLQSCPHATITEKFCFIARCLSGGNNSQLVLAGPVDLGTSWVRNSTKILARPCKHGFYWGVHSPLKLAYPKHGRPLTAAT